MKPTKNRKMKKENEKIMYFEEGIVDEGHRGAGRGRTREKKLKMFNVK